MARFLGCETKRGEQEGRQMSGVRTACNGVCDWACVGGGVGLEWAAL